jgi:5-hydroxyisourate hydrolase
MSASLSTHVLDTGRGQPASGVLVELFQAEELVATGVTGTDGRIADFAAELDPGSYRLVFHPESDFFARVELEVALGEGHFHVPLLVSPYSCTTYRGS